MKEFLYWVIEGITFFHRGFLQLNNRFNWSLNDKQLHFYVFGLACFILFLIVHYVFKRLAKISIMTISWFYTLTVAIVLAFAIEIGQKQTNTGNMEFWDIVYGINGYLFFFTIFIVTMILYRVIKRYLFNKRS
jgi:hypothetical protein